MKTPQRTLTFKEKAHLHLATFAVFYVLIRTAYILVAYLKLYFDILALPD